MKTPFDIRLSLLLMACALCITALLLSLPKMTYHDEPREYLSPHTVYHIIEPTEHYGHGEEFFYTAHGKQSVRADRGEICPARLARKSGDV